MRAPHHAVPEAAQRQAGVFTSAQAVEEGWTQRQVTRRLRFDHWRRLAGRGLVAADSTIGPWQRAWAATLTWPGVVIAGTTAAALHGFPVPTGTSVEVYCCTRRRPVPGITPRRRALTPAEVTFVAELAVTSPTRTAWDCLAAMDWDAALDLYAWLSTRHVLTHEQLRVLNCARSGRVGAPQVARLLRYTRHGAVSAAEFRFHIVMRTAGICGWSAGVEISDADGVIGQVDILFPRARLVVEIDGMRAHVSPEAFRKDRRKQNRLINAGYRILRFTWWDLTQRPDLVISQVREALVIGTRGPF